MVAESPNEGNAGGNSEICNLRFMSVLPMVDMGLFFGLSYTLIGGMLMPKAPQGPSHVRGGFWIILLHKNTSISIIG